MHPRLFTIGHFTQHTYGVLVALAFLVGVITAVKLARRERLDPDKVFNLAIYVSLAGFVGAKLLLVLTDLGYYTQHPSDIFSLSSLQAGGVFYGGFLGAVACALWYTRHASLPLLKTTDVFAPAVALGHSVGRLGCFSAGCCYGKPTSLPWGVTFHDPYSHEMFGTPLGTPLHPTQLYESVAELLTFFLLYWRLRHKKFDGQVMALYLAVYGAFRFLVEFVRDDPDRGFVFGGWMSTSQFIAILMMALAAGLWAWKHAVPAAAQGPASARS